MDKTQQVEMDDSTETPGKTAIHHVAQVVEESDPHSVKHWSKSSRYMVLAGAYLMLMVVSLQSTVAISLVPYVTSDFAAHSLIPLTNLLAFVVSGVIQLPLSRVVNLFGHLNVLLLMVFVETLGHILMATCQNIEWYAAAFVLFEAAFGGLLYLLRVLVVDCVHMEHRAIAYGLTTFPYLVTPFAGPPMAASYLNHSSWRWAFGTFAILVPAAGAILSALLLWGQKTAPKIQVTKTSKSLRQHLIDFDVVGMILACIGIGMLLVSITVATARLLPWDSAAFIAMLIVSVIVLIVLVCYEKLLAPKPFVTLSILGDRSAWGATLCVAGEYLSYGIWHAYFTSYLQVVFYESISDAGYINNAYYIGWGCISGLAGLLINYIGRYKAATAGGVSLMILSTGLMTYCSRPGQSVGGIIACQILFAISAGIITVSMMMAVLNKAKPNEIAMRMALFYMISMLCSALGSTISTAIWRNTLPATLHKYLPEDLKADAGRIAGSIVVQMSYKKGSTGREAIILAFAEAWKYLMIGGAAALGLSVVGVFVMKEGATRTSEPSESVEKEAKVFES